jgi:indolepyruvate ferredoxin oxidoreductase, beta subunit
MSSALPLNARPADARLDTIIRLVIMAVGGQGGGVLTNWIETLARANGFACQATSVAGVSQRTGATIYYIEMCPASERMPVFSLMPAAGDVDILVAAEMMEAGRAILRGFVTPDRTTLIASTHRALAISEKVTPGGNIANSDEVIAAAEIAAQRLVLADFEALALASGSVISASLLGGIAGAEVLPFAREAFEAAIRKGGKGIEGSLRAFAAGYDAAKGRLPAAPATPGPALAQKIRGPERDLAQWHVLMARAEALPPDVAAMALPGLRKVVDFQSLAYGEIYLSRVEQVLALDDAARGYVLTSEAAKYIANAMAYDDVIRVADLKTRGSRFTRIEREMGAGEARLLQLTEFFHPRAEEIAGMLPAGLGARVEASERWMKRLDRWFNKGRRLRTRSIGAFLALYFIGGLRGWRLKTLRHAQEVAHLEAWLNAAYRYLPDRYDLAVEVIRNRRLVKGYSDTHARGLSKFDRVMAGIRLVDMRADAPDWARRLREAALKDEEGKALDGALRTIESFTGSDPQAGP